MAHLLGDIKNEKGVLTLMSVLIVGAIGLSVGVSLLLLGLANSRTNLALQQSNQAKVLADACTEEALQQIRDLGSYVGSGVLTLGQGTCLYAVTNTGGTTRKITASGTVGSVRWPGWVAITAPMPAGSPNSGKVNWRKAAPWHEN